VISYWLAAVDVYWTLLLEVASSEATYKTPSSMIILWFDPVTSYWLRRFGSFGAIITLPSTFNVVKFWPRISTLKSGASLVMITRIRSYAMLSWSCSADISMIFCARSAVLSDMMGGNIVCGLLLATRRSKKQ
jgi:hypothetical protein